MQKTSEDKSGKDCFPGEVETGWQKVMDLADRLRLMMERDPLIPLPDQGYEKLVSVVQQDRLLLRQVATQCSTELQRFERSVQDLLCFERLISNLCARVLNNMPEEVDRGIDQALDQIREFFQVSRCGFLEVSHGGKPARFTHIASSGEAGPIPLQVDVSGSYPWCLDKLVNEKQAIHVSDLEDLPQEAGADLRAMKEYGIQTMLLIPLVREDEVVHIIAISSHNSNRRPWSEEYIPPLRLLGELFMHALQRRQAEEALRTSEERFRQFFKNTPDYCYILSPQGTVLNVNHAALLALGCQREDLVGTSVDSIYSPESRMKLRDLFSRLRENGEVKNEEMSIICRDGTKRDVLLNAGVLRNQSGTIICTTAVQTDISDLKRSENNLREAYARIEQLKDQLEAENLYLKKEMELNCQFKGIIGESTAIRSVLHKVEQVAPTDSLVLITGETGTGKELIAQAIHNNSRRRQRVMIKINCASLPTGLVESELFGREKGAYTGALTRQAGRFEVAAGSTLFLDEIGELSPEVQAKLLRVLQDGEFERLGSTRTIKVNVRIIASTNRDLAKEVNQGRFRQDLFYRLNVFPIRMPPLRDRMEDIPLLLWSFIDEFSEKLNKKIHTIPKGAVAAMQRYPWPGNIRELRNVIEQAVIISSRGILHIQLPEQTCKDARHALTLEEAESLHILRVLELTGGRIKGKGGAAEVLELKPSTLYSRMNRLGILTRRRGDDMST